jgi:bifunctional non-homologous end joining protein LigD
VIDGELIAAGRHGQPDFLAPLQGQHVPTCVYCFDLLELNGRDLREQPLVQRRAATSVVGACQVQCDPFQRGLSRR